MYFKLFIRKKTSDTVTYNDIKPSLVQTIQAKNSKTSFEKNCFSAWASTLNMGLINKVDMVCLSPVGYGV